jgi:hypothetical protein
MKLHNINTPYKHNQTNRTIERCLFNKFDSFRCYDKRYGRGSWFVRYEFKSLVGKGQMIGEIIGLGII